ncbi:protein FAM114A2 [Ceratina calcarata]|uniref:Protein FAM114A2 n=1 Tax=Ceratina calcarata TaxID=156304 RepID=A0AAJ7IV02_9HYME|nr:protein FAM114A2 [Ceratina calcarata]
MATSESDDFESADEEMNQQESSRRNNRQQQWKPTTIDSESDDDAEFIPHQVYTNTIYKNRESYQPVTAASEQRSAAKVSDNSKTKQVDVKSCERVTDLSVSDDKKKVKSDKDESKASDDANMEQQCDTSQSNESEKDRKQKKIGTKKLGTRIFTNLASDNVARVDKDVLTSEESLLNKLSIKDEITESDMPEEMKSDKTFKEVFKTEGWEGLEDDLTLPEELAEEKLQPILKTLSQSDQEGENSSVGWGWGNWDVSTLINTASVGVSTLTSHVSHGLTLLEETMGLPDEPVENEEKEEDKTTSEDKEQPKEQSSFGFGNLISGVSSITKLVESTGSKVMSGGLDTLEAIGKKTMEVLQEGDPGLKKKRAFFSNEPDKPNLSQVLREAKEKAEANEKTIEEKQKLRKVHFESLFDDYQGLVHLEALEMLSKQSNIKIQQHLIELDGDELNSVQKMLEEVEELCELGEEDEDEDEGDEKDLKFKLQEACSDLGINITYDKLHSIVEDSKVYIAAPTQNDRELYEKAISTLAQFTAFSVERFHKTAELLLIKEHRSTVNETDSLVQLTNILSKRLSQLANDYCKYLNKIESSDNTEDIKSNITTIFMEASNASSYIQDAFKLLIPIIQVGAL